MPEVQRTPRVAIIGAGVSGLSAAVRLRQLLGDTVEIEIFESRRQAGGRTRSFTDPVSGDTLDNGQHLMMGCYTATLDYLKAIGTSSLIERKQLAIPFYDRTSSEGPATQPAILRTARSLPGPFHLLYGLLTSSLLSAREKRAAIRLGVLAKYGGLQRKAEQWSCAELFRHTHQPEGLIRKLWEPIVLATINSPIDLAPAILFLRVMQEALLDKRSASDILFPRVGLSDLLITPALSFLSRSATPIHLSTQILDIELLRTAQQSNAFRVITDASTSLQQTLGNDLTTTPRTFNILNTSKRTKEEAQLFTSVIVSSSANFKSLNVLKAKPSYSSIVNVYLWCDREIVTSEMNGFLGTHLQWLFAKKTRFGKQLLALTISAAKELVERSTEEIVDIVWEEIKQCIPNARNARLLRSQVIKEKRATPLFDITSNAERPTIRTSIEGLFLAGDLVQNGLPATIEGAIRNGFESAEQAALYLRTKGLAPEKV